MLRSLLLSRVCQVPPLLDRRGVMVRRDQSARASAQQNPASSRATATATIVRRLPRCSASRLHTRCSRCCACQAIAMMLAGCPSWRRCSVTPREGVLR
jgi:hypothetical protein